MPETTIPGIKARHVAVTPSAQKRYGFHEAFEAAVERLRDEYAACLNYQANEGATYHMALSIERPEKAPLL